MMKSILKGRTLWCAAQLVEILPKDYEEIHLQILKMALQILIEEKVKSVKLVATRCLIKYGRKLKSDLLTENISD